MCNIILLSIVAIAICFIMILIIPIHVNAKNIINELNKIYENKLTEDFKYTGNEWVIGSYNRTKIMYENIQVYNKCKEFPTLTSAIDRYNIRVFGNYIGLIKRLYEVKNQEEGRIKIHISNIPVSYNKNVMIKLADYFKTCENYSDIITFIDDDYIIDSVDLTRIKFKDNYIYDFSNFNIVKIPFVVNSDNQFRLEQHIHTISPLDYKPESLCVEYNPVETHNILFNINYLNSCYITPYISDEHLVDKINKSIFRVDSTATKTKIESVDLDIVLYKPKRHYYNIA